MWKKKKIWFSHSIQCADLCAMKILEWHTPVFKYYTPKPCFFSTLETQKNNNLVNLSQYVPHLSIMWSPQARINTSLIMAIFVHTAKIKFRFWHFIKRTPMIYLWIAVVEFKKTKKQKKNRGLKRLTNMLLNFLFSAMWKQPSLVRIFMCFTSLLYLWAIE